MTTARKVTRKKKEGGSPVVSEKFAEIRAQRVFDLKPKTETIVTNSCTGQVTTYESWEWTPSLFFVTFAVTILAIIISDIFFAVIEAQAKARK